MSSKAIGDIKFFSDDLEIEITIKEYFKELLRTLWNKEDGFNGKRPFGNSCWKNEIYAALGRNNIIHCVVDDDGGVHSYDCYEADEIVAEYIVEYL